jgi:hypothetical protein
MNRLFFIIIVIPLFIKLSFAQDRDYYILNPKSQLKTTPYLGPELKISAMIEGYQLYTGFKGGLLFNDRVAVGLSGGGFITETVFLSYGRRGDEIYLNTVMGYGGFNIDYIIFNKSPVQVSLPMLAGAAGVVLVAPDTTAGMTTDEKMVEGGVFIIYEPAINLEFNFTNFLRMGLGVGYRFAFRGDMDRLPPGDLSGLTFNWNIKFGSF